MPDQPRAFISYVREDSDEVDRLCKLLESAGIPYWRDREDLGPGDEWKARIVEAVRSEAFVFLACFSENYHKKRTSTMNEELSIAVEQFRLMTPGETWIIPVRFGDVSLPDFDLRPGLKLEGLNYVDLFGEDLPRQAVMLTTKVSKVLGRPAIDAAAVRTSVSEAVAEDRAEMLQRQTKEWIHEPTRRISLVELVNDESRRILGELRDETQHPLTFSQPPVELQRGLEVAERAQAIWDLMIPFLSSLDVAVRWGENSSLKPWQTGIRALWGEAEAMRSSGGESTLKYLRHLPVVASAMVIGFVGVRSARWDNVKTLLTDVSIPDRWGPPITVLEGNRPWSIADPDNLVIHALARHSAPERIESPLEEVLTQFVERKSGKLYTPVSDWLFNLIRPIVDDRLLGEEAYARDFDRAEVMLGVIAEDQANRRRQAAGGEGWIPLGQWYGRSTWRSGYFYTYGTSPVTEVQSELESQGADWEPVKRGLFGGDYRRATAAVGVYRERFEDLAQRRMR